MWIAETILWASIFIIVYTYALYPAVLMVISGGYQLKKDFLFLFHKIERRVGSNAADYPGVAVVIAAYNEEKVIEARVRNLLMQDYPADRYKIFIGSDGSTDKTAEILGRLTDERLEIFIFDENRGKVAVLNDLISRTGAYDLLVLSDANTHFEKDVISKLVRHFSDETVGVVCGELYLVESGSEDNKDSLYWKYERLLKFHEGRIGGLLGANGANYAIRRSLYAPLPEDTLIDDFTIVMRIAISGRKVKYDPEAIATEEVAPDVKGEYVRRVRIGAGNYQSFFRFSGFLWPKMTYLYFCYLSHKVFRWFVPHFMVLAFVSNLFLYLQERYELLFYCQLAFYLFYFLVYRIRDSVRVPGVVMFPLFILLMNIALASGFIKYLSGKSKGTWIKTAR